MLLLKKWTHPVIVCVCVHVCVPACPLRQGLCEDVRSKDDLHGRVSHHHLPECLLCIRELRGGQREDEVFFISVEDFSCVFAHQTSLKSFQVSLLKNSPFKTFNTTFNASFPPQGVRKVNQTSVLSVLQPVHSEHRPAQGHPRHRERGARPAQWPHHRVWRSGQDEHLHGHLKPRPPRRSTVLNVLML